MKNISFLPEKFRFLEVNFSIYLNRRVFVMDYLFWVHVCLNILNLVFLYINYDFPKYDFGMLTSDSFFNLSPNI